MRVGVAIFAILISLSLQTLAADDAGYAALDREIARFLTALDWGRDARESFAAGVARGDVDAESARLSERISEQRFVELSVPLFRSVVSLEEAREMADFYESDAMRAMLAAQKTPYSPPVATTQEQAAAVQTFLRSKAGQAARRMQKAMSEPEFAEKLAAALEQELQTLKRQDR